MRLWHTICRRYHQLMAQDYFGRASVTPYQVPFLDSHAPELLDYYMLHRHVHDYLPTKIVAYGAGTWATVLGWAVFRFRQDNLAMHLWVIDTSPATLKEYRKQMPKEFEPFVTLRNENPVTTGFHLSVTQASRDISSLMEVPMRSTFYDPVFDVLVTSPHTLGPFGYGTVRSLLFRNR